jgi:MFS family permease
MEYAVERLSSKGIGFSWSSVFAGTFIFLAIEITFGMLAWAIFGSQASSLSAGAGIWMIILSIIALYFGALTAAHFSNEGRRLNRMYYGLVTFGLSIFSSIMIAAMAVGSAATSARSLLDGVAANAGWLFVALILGGIAAAIGGAFSTDHRKVAPSATGEHALHKAA